MTIRLSQRQRHYDAVCRMVVMMMIMATLLLLCNISTYGAAAASSSSSFQPDISVGIRRDSSTDSISLLLEPTVRWTTSSSSNDESLKYEGGVIIRGEHDGTIPCTIFGQISKQVKKWNLKTKFDTSSEKIQKVRYDVSAVGGPTNIQMNCNGNIYLDSDNTNDIISVNKIQLKQSLFGNNKKNQLLTISPSYVVSSKSTDLSLSYRIKDTTLNLDSNNIIQNKLKNNKYTLKQQLNSESTIASSIRSNIDDVDFEYKHSLLEGVGTIYYKPNNNIKLQYNDDLWEASMIAPIITSSKGLFGITKVIDTDRIQISIRRNIS